MGWVGKGRPWTGGCRTPIGIAPNQRWQTLDLEVELLIFWTCSDSLHSLMLFVSTDSVKHSCFTPDWKTPGICHRSQGSKSGISEFKFRTHLEDMWSLVRSCNSLSFNSPHIEWDSPYTPNCMRSKWKTKCAKNSEYCVVLHERWLPFFYIALKS